MTPSKPQFQSQDDSPLIIVRSNISGGMNSRQNANVIGDNQMAVIYNIDLGIPGQTSRRPGSVLVANDIGADSIIGLHNFQIQGEPDWLIAYEDTKLWKWDGSASTWTDLGETFTAATEVGIIAAKESGETPDDVFIVQNGIDNAHLVNADWEVSDLGSTAGTGSDSPPISTVMAWYANRIWVLKNDLLYFSAAYSGDYSKAFDTATDMFRVPVGTERGIVPTRTEGLIIMGEDSIWALAPSLVPDPSADKPQPIITNRGVVGKKAWVNAGDDIYYFAQDGFRALKRTEQDKLQAGADYPLSYCLKDEFEAINWGYIDRVIVEYFDNKIFIGVPTGAATFDTWIYYPALTALNNSPTFSIIKGWSPRCWCKYKVGGEERLYYGLHGDGEVYRAWYGYTDEGTSTTNGTAINYQEEGRKEDGGQPLVKKQGGSVKVEAASIGDYDLTVYASFDEDAYVLLGTLNLADDSPTLPVNLPFTLAPSAMKRGIFHLDPYDAWYTMQLKIVSNENTSSDTPKIYSRGFITFATQQKWGDE